MVSPQYVSACVRVKPRNRDSIESTRDIASFACLTCYQHLQIQNSTVERIVHATPGSTLTMHIAGHLRPSSTLRLGCNFFTCFFKSLLWLKALPQQRHLYGFAPVCVLMCSSICLRWPAMNLPQILQVCCSTL